MFYKRQINLKEVGQIGQQKLKNSRVLIIGAGGLGHPSAIYLAAAGIGTLGILDFDVVEVSNLNRQIAFEEKDLGLKKALVLSERIEKQNPFIKIHPLCERIDSQNIESILKEYDIVLDCTDNLKTKFLIHDFCWHLEKDLIQASIYQYEGQIQSFYYSKNKSNGCLRCLWPEVPPNNVVKNCKEAGLIGSIAGILGTIQASETTKMILGLGEKLENRTKIINLLDLE
ncbi:MAG: HesA/MoeB/ThiF family protein, partial [Bacteriovoracaceae bacterium]|nr:HesA/MoeB/ThiF family protein [Bacteriovoracaceae bacterium]